MPVLPVEQIKERVGQELGASAWMEIGQDRVNQFADCTEDHQWIHVDTAKAKAGPFGTTIAHGYLMLALIPHLSDELLLVPEGAKMVINYGLNKIRFINPVRMGSKVRDRLVLSGLEEKPGNRVLVTLTHNIEIEGKDKPACVAEAMTMYFMR